MDHKDKQDAGQGDQSDPHTDRHPLGLDVGTSRILLTRGVGSGAKTECDHTSRFT